MKAFIEIRARPSPELNSGQVVNQVMQRLHDVLVREPTLTLAVSFPEHRSGSRASLGEIVRLHGQFELLESLSAGTWLLGAREAVSIGTVANTPRFAKTLVRFSRVQPKASTDRASRRRARYLMQVSGKSEADALKQAQDEATARERGQQTLDLPYLRLRSGSTGQIFRLFISKQLAEIPGPEASFNRFGLSTGGTVPHW